MIRKAFKDFFSGHNFGFNVHFNALPLDKIDFRSCLFETIDVRLGL